MLGTGDRKVTTTRDPLLHAFKHSVATNITIDQHHLRPSNISISNTTQAIEPLPGGPGEWDVPVPFDAKVARLTLRADWQTNDQGGEGGGHWVVTRTAYLDATGFDYAGPVGWQSGAYISCFAKPAASLDLSHRIYTASGPYVALTDAYLAQTGATTRVLRMSFTNYGAAYYTLHAVGEVEILG